MKLACPNCDKWFPPFLKKSDTFKCDRCSAVLQLEADRITDLTWSDWVRHFQREFCSGWARPVIAVALHVLTFFAAKALWDMSLNIQGSIAAESWPVVAGKIVSLRGSNVLFESIVTYSYSVNDQKFESAQVTYGRKDAKFTEGKSSLQSLKGAEKINVYYNPMKPSESVLWTGVSRGDYVEGGFLLFVVVLLVVGHLVVWWLSKPDKMEARLCTFRRLYAKIRYFRQRRRDEIDDLNPVG